MDITITCRNKHCKTSHNPTPNRHFIRTIHATTHDGPMHCPTCISTVINHHASSYVDSLCMQYMGVHPKLAAKMIEMCNDHNAHKPAANLYPSDIITTLYRNIKPIADTAWQTYTCTACCSAYSIMVTNDTPVRFCIYCGSQSLIRTVTNDLYASLSALYGIPASLVSAFYTQWQAQAYYVTYRAYLESPSIAPVINTVRNRTLV